MSIGYSGPSIPDPYVQKPKDRKFYEDLALQNERGSGLGEASYAPGSGGRERWIQTAMSGNRGGYGYDSAADAPPDQASHSYDQWAPHLRPGANQPGQPNQSTNNGMLSNDEVKKQFYQQFQQTMGRPGTEADFQGQSQAMGYNGQGATQSGLNDYFKQASAKYGQGGPINSATGNPGYQAPMANNSGSNNPGYQAPAPNVASSMPPINSGVSNPGMQVPPYVNPVMPSQPISPATNQPTVQPSINPSQPNNQQQQPNMVSASMIGVSAGQQPNQNQRFKTPSFLNRGY